MPLVEITLAEGRSPEQLRTLLSATTHAVATSVGAPLDSIRVVLREVPRTHWAAGDVTLAERDATRDPAAPSDPGPRTGQTQTGQTQTGQTGATP